MFLSQERRARVREGENEIDEKGESEVKMGDGAFDSIDSVWRLEWMGPAY